ncbi:MAG TPA: glutathione synthase [Burkholderiaceae bacterium]|nr:glutathione synthase [Burkholderiaceae bacterium]
MALALLFIVDPLDQLKAYKDTSVAMMREAGRRGHAVYACTPDELAATEAAVTARVHRLHLTNDDHAWYEEQGAQGGEERDLASFDAVLMRKDPPFDVEFLNATLLLSRAAALGARVVNDARALRDHNEKLAVLEFPQFTVPTLVTREAERIRGFWAYHGDIIVKPLDGMGGTGVFRLQPGDPNAGSILETVTARGARTAMAQKFIPAIRDGDKRVLVIDGEPVPYCLARIPKAGETRGNLAAGGIGRAQPLGARDREIARVVGQALLPRGLRLLGLDVIGEFLTEINVTSPTCFVEIAEQAGCNVAGIFIDALERGSS